MALFHVTYDITTHESAEQGDYAESGFVTANSEHVDMTGLWGRAAGEVKAVCGMTLCEACRLIGCLDSYCGGPSFYEADGNTDYRTGDNERRALHCPDNITPSSLQRVARLLGAVPDSDGERHRYHAATFA